MAARGGVEPATFRTEDIDHHHSTTTPLNCRLFFITPGPREHLDQVTHWLDGSEVYGSNQDEMDLLRDYSDPRRGRMAVTAHPHGNRYKPLLPKEVVTPSMPSECENVNETHVCLQAGDTTTDVLTDTLSLL